MSDTMNMAVKQSRYSQFSIELDCAPGNPRPGDLIDGVLADTGLTASDFETCPPFFGNQVWVLREDAGKDAIYTAQRNETLKPRIEALYHQGFIRYGSW